MYVKSVASTLMTAMVIQYGYVCYVANIERYVNGCVVLWKLTEDQCISL